MEIASGEFASFTGYIKDITGIELDESKRYFLESRVGPLLEKHRCGSYADFHARARADASGLLRKALVEAVTTHETSFFRDSKPFDLFRLRLLPRLLDKDPNRPVRIWSAACSTGQEAYSLAIIVLEVMGERAAGQVEILGTDISQDSLQFAQAGKFREFEAHRGLSEERLARFFSRKADGYVANPALRNLVRFQAGNILEPSRLGPFDFILCRNVAIYFCPGDRQRLYANLADCLKPDGILFLGATEILTGPKDRFVRKEEMGAVYYRPAGRGRPA